MFISSACRRFHRGEDGIQAVPADICWHDDLSNVTAMYTRLRIFVAGFC